MMSEKKWEDMSAEERREDRFKRWLSPSDMKFSSSEAEKRYQTRANRFIDVIKLQKPDRVPVMLPAGFFPAYYAGGNLKSVMYDYDELKRAWMKFIQDFDMDTLSGPWFVIPGKVLDMLDYKLHHWPGHGTSDDDSFYQYIEGEYMTAEEYDAFIKDPTDFLLRTYLPRSNGALGGLSKLGFLTPFIGIPVFYISRLGDPEVRDSVLALLEAAQECVKWQSAVMDVSIAAKAKGIPSIMGGLSGAPFDLIGDMMRGTKGIMMDMYRRPEKLHAAMERITPIIIDEAVAAGNASGSPVIMMPLHKGTGGFMSNDQFKEFYWPTLKEVMMGLIEEGLVPMPFAEGDYGDRLETIKDMPKGTVIWYFETMDMTRAKRVLGDNACIAGNLPVSILCTGTPAQVKDGCRRLIETCAQGGGYILTGSASIHKGDPDNLRAMMEAAEEYGLY